MNEAQKFLCILRTTRPLERECKYFKDDKHTAWVPLFDCILDFLGESTALPFFLYCPHAPQITSETPGPPYLYIRIIVIMSYIFRFASISVGERYMGPDHTSQRKLYSISASNLQD
ncbi:hypothetical protein RSAG8_02454, partial [Rhizoctonia solani AG-8 WAC10335]